MFFGSPISRIEEGAFRGLTHLKILDIANCGLTSMPPLTDVKNSLDQLRLDVNNISVVPNGYFRGFQKLTYLTLARNSLTRVPDVADLSSTLDLLNLRQNKITSLPKTMRNVSMVMLEAVSIVMNPLHCDSSLAWLIGLNNTGNDDVTTTIPYSGADCGSPPWLKGRALDDIGLCNTLSISRYHFSLTHKSVPIQCALDISRSISPNISRKTLIARPFWRCMGVFRGIQFFEINVLCAVLCYMVPQYIGSL